MNRSDLFAAAAMVLFAAGGAHAMPVPPMSDNGAAGVTLVRGGCGFGAHRGPYGGCRLNNGPRGAMRQIITGAPRGCPPGMYRGPYGRCRYR